jgi:hypothetical protein
MAKVWATQDERWVYATISGSREARDDLKALQRRFSVDFGLCFLKDFQAILYDEFDGPLREVVHLFVADAKERLPTELFDTLEPRLLPRKKFGRVLPIQKFIQRKVRPPGVAKIPVRFHLLWAKGTREIRVILYAVSHR